MANEWRGVQAKSIHFRGAVGKERCFIFVIPVACCSSGQSFLHLLAGQVSGGAPPGDRENPTFVSMSFERPAFGFSLQQSLNQLTSGHSQFFDYYMEWIKCPEVPEGIDRIDSYHYIWLYVRIGLVLHYTTLAMVYTT